MASFPATIKAFIAKVTGGVIEASHINDLQDEVTALETKVGVDGSAVTSTLDYKVKNTASVDPGHKHSVSSISATGTPDSTTFLRGDGQWVSSSGEDASTTVKGITKLSVAPAVANNPIAVGDNDGRLPTQAENDALVGTSGTAVSGTNKLVDNADTGTSGANKVLRLDGTGKLPAVDGSNLTNLPSQFNFTISPSASFTSNGGDGALFSADVVGTLTKYKTITYKDLAGTIRVSMTPTMPSGGIGSWPQFDIEIRKNNVAILTQTNVWGYNFGLIEIDTSVNTNDVLTFHMRCSVAGGTGSNAKITDAGLKYTKTATPILIGNTVTTP